MYNTWKKLSIVNKIFQRTNSPCVVLVNYNGKVDCFDQLVPDLGFAYLSTSLSRANIEHVFYDLNLWKNSEIQLIESIRQNSPYFVGMKLQNIGNGLSDVLKLAHRIKKKTGTSLIAGGPIVRLFEENCYKVKEFHVFDALVYGEGEETIIKLYKAFENDKYFGDVPNLLYMEDGEIKKTEWKLVDLDKYSPISWDAFELENYLPILPINMKRGCQYACSFCSHSHLWGRKEISDNLCITSNQEFKKLNIIRKRSWENIREEIERNYYKYGVNNLYIVDSTPSKRLLNQLASFTIKNNLNIKWIAFARFGLFNEKDMDNFKKGGLSALWYGWESGDVEILNLMHKNISIEQVRNTYSILKTKDIFFAGTFIIGHPGETKKSVEKTFKFIQELQLDNYSISPFRLTPGSYISYNPQEYNIRLYPNWKEKILKGYLQGKSELETEYYSIDEITNVEWWKLFEKYSDYQNWFDMRVRENTEISHLMASHLGMKHLEFLMSFLKVIEQKNSQKLHEWLERLWNTNHEIQKVPT